VPAVRYRLRPRWGVLVAAMLLFGGGAVLFVHLASTNDRGLILYGFELDVGEARVAYGVLALLSGGFVALGILGTARLALGRLQVVLDDKIITVPRVLGPPAILAYPLIRDAYVMTTAGQEFLTIVGPARNVSVARSHLSGGDFDDLVEQLAARLPQAQLARVERRRERPLAKPPLAGPPRVETDPFRAPPVAPPVRPIETAAPPAAAPVVADAEAPNPKLLR
jgi:hypothetical protein